MSIKLFNSEIDQFGSGLCAITSVVLVVAALWAVFEVGKYLVSGIISIF